MKNILIVLTLLVFTSCLKDSDSDKITDYTEQNEQEIIDYISQNNLNALRSTTGLYYVIENLGTGKQPTNTSNITVAYKGYYTNESIFDQSDSNGISLGLQQVIKGWTEGITYFKEGGNGMLLIPSHLGYGSSNHLSIPGGSVLIFDIKLISVND